ncbi:VCBS repeat-containing protein [Segetibacter koreensis]|uniref:VCBS repeat-containing protein n=1 Tax=Segetibacter koreensis TaxID=398037 RepID=UPI00037A7E6C|nr:VCBS repeat-containing protein [Segetibacter koreensis]
MFTKLDKDKTGIKFQNTLFEDGPLNVANYIYFYNGSGVSIGDINNDGLQDILFTGNMVRNRLYLNKGNFEFEDITQKSGVAEKQGWCTGATMVDINGDGKLDIYICRSADINPRMRKNLLFINNGNLTFSEKAEEYGLADAGYSTQASFFDYDKDGDLDCFIINHSLQKYTAGIQDNADLRKEYNPDFADKLYQNNNSHFIDVSRKAGIVSNVFTFGLGVSVSDINNDGWPDIYVSNDFNEHDYLFINNRNGTFTESISQCMDEVSLYSMGTDAADFDNDGLIDIATLDMAPEDNKIQKMHSGAENFDKFQNLFSKGFYYQYSRNMLQKNNGDGTFSEIGQLAHVSNTDWSWSALFGDYDNDGYKDLLVTNGYVKDYTDMDFLKYSVDRVVRTMHHDSVDAIPEYIRKMPTLKIPNYILKNNGNETFTKTSTEWGLDEPGVSSGAAYADLDNDGDLDLVINNSNDYASIYKNNNEAILKNNFIRVRLQGNKENERGIGAKVKVFCRGNEYYQEEFPTRGFQSSVDPVLNFGIGKNTAIDSIIVIWPNDSVQKFISVKANQILTVKIGDAKEKWRYNTVMNKKRGILSEETLSEVQHRENDFNDFTVQSLLPNYLSRQGPCIQVADINKDGLEDFFIGGAKNELSKIFIQNANSTFTIKEEPAFLKDVASEDVAATFFDADGDGDKDLYVGSGGYEFAENDPALQDRLYINDGKGNFTRKANALPDMLISTGCVKAGDIDGDGDDDLFVGGRLVPGKYPVSPESKILSNDGKGIFTDVTASIAKPIQKIGMVTDAAWIDMNKDNKLDLVIVGEWMPIKVFINQKGKFIDQSSSFIHFKSTGWWNRINATDMDGDGDTDLIVGNCGINTQFHADEKEPMTMYYKDFDNNGSIDPVLCYYIGGVSYPAASRDDITEQLPGLKKKFLEYKEYANATIHDLFTEDQLKDATILKAETMQTVFLENEGSTGFVQHNLPIQAQYAPVYAIAAADVNHDGKKDILMAGNNTWTRIKFGRYSANHGILMIGNGRGSFNYLPQPASGLNIRGNVRSMEVISVGKDVEIICGINDSAAKIIKQNNPQ